MKSLAIASTLALTAAAIAGPSRAQTPYATERGTVLSVTPNVQRMSVARPVCHDEPVAVQPQPSGGGALLGAIAGGVLGNALGSGSGRAAATAVGVIGGAAVGNSIEASRQATQVQTVRRCTTQPAYEERPVSYTVVYEYAGREYTTQMRQDPGRYVQVQVDALPDGDDGSLYAPPPRARSAPPASSSRPPPVYIERPVHPTYAEPEYAEPVYQQTYPVPVPVAPVVYGPAYPQFGTGLVVGALIGYGAYGVTRHHHGGYRWRGNGR